MQLTVLCDNYTSTYSANAYLAEQAFSVYIEDGADRILFDCGYSDVFLQNAGLMNIDVGSITKAVFSHGHDDHTRGLIHLLPLLRTHPDIYAHPDTFFEKKRGEENIGSPFRAAELAKMFTLHLSKKPQKVSENLTVLGEIPQITSFESRRQFDVHDDGCGKFVPDFVLEDSALVYERAEDLCIITGCSHAGICNICEYAKRLFIKPVHAVLGGFHLKEADERAVKTVRYFKENHIEELWPCHCVSFAVKALINQSIPLGEGGVGLKLTW